MKTIELIDKYAIRQSGDPDYDPPDYKWIDNTGEVIRCKDCKHWIFDGVMVCDRFTDASLKPDDYCSYAERIANGD